MIWKGGQQLFQVLNGSLGVHLRRAQNYFFAGMQVKGAVEIHLLSLRIRANDRGLASQSPHSHRGGLEIERSLILSQKHRIGSILRFI